MFLLLLNTNKQNAKAQPYTPPPRTRPQHAIADDGAVPVRAVAQKAAVESPESKHYNLAWSRQIPLDDCNPWNGFACIPLVSLKRQRRTSRDVPAGWWHFPDMVWCCLNKHYYNGQMIGLSVVSAEHWPAEVSLELRLPITSVYSAEWFAATWTSCVAKSQAAAVVKFELSWDSRTRARTTANICDLLQMDPKYSEPNKSSQPNVADADLLFGAGDEQYFQEDVADATCDIEAELTKLMEAEDDEARDNRMCIGA